MVERWRPRSYAASRRMHIAVPRLAPRSARFCRLGLTERSTSLPTLALLSIIFTISFIPPTLLVHEPCPFTRISAHARPRGCAMSRHGRGRTVTRYDDLSARKHSFFAFRERYASLPRSLPFVLEMRYIQILWSTFLNEITGSLRIDRKKWWNSNSCDYAKNDGKKRCSLEDTLKPKVSFQILSSSLSGDTSHPGGTTSKSVAKTEEIARYSTSLCKFVILKIISQK